MKDSTPAPSVSKIGSFTESKFGIASNDDLVYIFDILRNKLYSDKALAVVREYCTNAADANTESGNQNRPIVITVPTRMSPVFKVRDFGFGLTEEQIRTVYCMYGRSTKRESNAYTGQLGLGSKSGFSYGDSFTVSSFKDGVKTVYSAYIDETRLGSVAKIHDERTDEENGIEISIPVKSVDLGVFATKIANVTRFFKTKPIINGSIEEDGNLAIYSGKNWRVCSNKPGHNRYQKYGVGGGFNNAIAIMGNIGYPIDTTLVFPDIKDYWRTNLPNEFKFLSGLVEIEFDIGDLSIAASREELEYNSVTIAALRKAGAKYYQELISAINAEVSKAKDGILARIALAKINDFTTCGAWGDLESSVSWRGKKMNGSIVTMPGNDSAKLSTFYYISGNNKPNKDENSSSFFVTSNVVSNDCLWLLDDSKNCNLKMLDMAKKNPGVRFHLLRLTDGVQLHDGSVVNGDEWLVKNDIPKSYFKPISEYAYEKERSVSTRTTARKSKGEVVVYKMKKDTRNYGTQSENWEQTVIDASQVELYVEINKFQPIINGKIRSIESLKNLFKALKHFGIQHPDVYGVKTSDIGKVSDSTSIYDFTNKSAKTCTAFTDVVSKTSLKKVISECDAWNLCPLISSCLDKIDLNGTVSVDSVFYKFVSTIKKYSKAQESISYGVSEHAASICEFGKISSDDYNKAAAEELNALVKKFKEAYPLLKYSCSISSSERQTAIPAVYDYVNKSGI